MYVGSSGHTTITSANQMYRDMEDDNDLEKDFTDNRSVIYDHSFDGFCSSDPMFQGVFDMACFAGSQAFSNQLTTANEGSSQAAPFTP